MPLPMREAGSCLKCSGKMEEGFIIDEGYGTRSVSAWVAGKPINSMWFGLKLKQADRRPISSYRCTRCGLLENYVI